MSPLLAAIIIAGFLSVPQDAFDLQGLIFIEDADSFVRADFYRDTEDNVRIFFGEVPVSFKYHRPFQGNFSHGTGWHRLVLVVDQADV